MLLVIKRRGPVEARMTEPIGHVDGVYRLDTLIRNTRTARTTGKDEC